MRSEDDRVQFIGGGQVRDALDSPDLVPPPRTFSDGATADLRDEMARFSTDALHTPRRHAVVEFLDTLDEVQIISTAQRLTAATLAELDGEPLRVVLSQHGFVYLLPTYVLATVLGHDSDAEQIRADVEAVARVIGRGEAVASGTDDATVRLLTRFGDFPEPVAVVSVFYQNHDATAGLLAGTILEQFGGVERSTAGFQTVRSAKCPVTIGDTELTAGQQVAIDLSAPELEFGAGPHECPGEKTSRAIVTGAMNELAASGYSVDATDTRLNEFGRPTVLTMHK